MGTHSNVLDIQIGDADENLDDSVHTGCAPLNVPMSVEDLEAIAPYGSQPLKQPIRSSIKPLEDELEVLAAIKERHDAEKGQDGSKDPVDALLMGGLGALMEKLVDVVGVRRQPGILITFDSLTFSVKVPNPANSFSQRASLHSWWKSRYMPKLILNNTSGSFRPGRLTLILGPPQSGKSSLMKAIAGRLGSNGLSGAIEYAGRRIPPGTRAKGQLQLPKLVGYIPQLDSHIATLTVRETMQFAHACTSKLSPGRLEHDNLDEEANEFLQKVDTLSCEILMTMLGIRHVGDTLVGDEKLRGISGGQRKRLTSGEILASRTPVLLADEISTGLDSATTYDICAAMKSHAAIHNRTTIVSLLQPTPETFELFDEVVVMAAGSIAYQGPGHKALQYFEALGFQCPATKDVAEFLQEVTLAEGIRRYRSGRPCPVNCPADFGELWLKSALFAQRKEEDKLLLRLSKEQMDDLPANSHVFKLLSTPYTRSFPCSVALCLKRQAVLTMRNPQVTKGRLMQILVIGFLVGSLFFRLNFKDSNGKFSVLFFSMMFMSVAGMAMIPGVIAERKVAYRQMESCFFPPLAYSIAVHLVDWPVSIAESLLFSTIVYWMVGFSATADGFCFFVFTIFLVKITMTALFKLLALAAPNDAAAFGMGAIIILITTLHSGYVLAQEDVKPGWIWSYWVNPLQYGMTSLSINEFHANRYAVPLVPGDPTKGTLGDFLLTIKKMPATEFRKYLGLICNTGIYAALVTVYSLVARYLRWPDKLRPLPPQGQVISPPETREMPFVPCTLAWDNLCYDVDDPKDKKGKRKHGLRLLDHVSGFAAPHTMTALMGASGAGKTTLLDVLAGRKNTGRVHGHILLNGQTADPVTFSRNAGYVEQMDIHSPSSTVAEALYFSALLRLPRDMSAAQKEAYMWQVLVMLKLEPVAHCRIGTKGNGLSVEQMKRLTIGVEMAANPTVLFLDEPTSGLDSVAADVVMDAIKAVARSGRTILCTVHQPSRHLFSMFDHLLLLMAGGRTVFFGETGERSASLITYLQSIPGVPSHNGTQNPATWMLDVLGTTGIDFHAAYTASELRQRNDQLLRGAMERTGPTLSSGQRYQASNATQLRILLKKWALLHCRTLQYNLPRIFISIASACLVGSIFFHIQGNDEQSIFSKAGVQFNAFMFLGILFTNMQQSTMATERSVFYREKAANMYRPIWMNTAAALCEIPFILLNTVIFTNIFYWMVGLNPDLGVYGFWYLLFLLHIMFSTYYGFLLSCLASNSEMATGLAGASLSTFSLLCGFMLPRASIPWYWRWIHYICPHSYEFQAFLSTQFYCVDPPDAPGSCPSFTSRMSGTPTVVPVWVFVRDFFDLSYDNHWMYAGIIAVLALACHIGSGLTLQFVNHDKR